jgi:hypothetical protein
MTGSRAFAFGGLGLAIVGAVGAIVVRLATQAPFLPITFGFGPLAMIAFIIMGLSWASIGAFLVIRRPHNVVGLLMVVAGAGYSLSMLGLALTFAFAAEQSASGQDLAELVGWVTVLCTNIGAAVFAIGFIFPTGRAQSPGWARLIRFSWPFVLVLGAGITFQPGPLHLFPTLENPFGFGPDFRAGQPVSPLVWVLSLFLGPLLSLSVATRYRMAGPTERQQLKWFGLALIFAVFAVGFSAYGAARTTGTPAEVGLAVYGFVAAGVPVAIAIAILRHHLYDIDRIFSRTIAYGLVTAILATVFGGAIVVSSAALASFAQGETIAVAASTLAAFAVFQPVLRIVRRQVDRRFNRARYDAEETVARFSDRLRAQVDLAHLSGDLDATIRDAIAPQSVGIWLRTSRR